MMLNDANTLKVITKIYLVIFLMFFVESAKADMTRLTIQQYQFAAKHGNAEAQNNLGIIYRKGEEVAQDLVSSFMWFDLAAKQGNEISIKNKNELLKFMDPRQVKKAKEMAVELKLSPSIKPESLEQNLVVDLEQYKTQCKQLGFKAGTQDFGNCVLQLNEGN
jgi:TPR repeat protein